MFSLRLISVFLYSDFVSHVFPMDPLAALFISLAGKDLPLVEHAVDCSVLTVLDQGKLPLPHLESVYSQSRAHPEPELSPQSPCCAELEPGAPVSDEPEPNGTRRAEDRRGAGTASNIRPGARAGYNARHKEYRNELCTLHHG